MPIAEIIHEIDAYLSRLRQARDILSAPMTDGRPKRSPKSKTIKGGAKVPTAAAKPGIPEGKPRRVQRISARKPAKERADSVAARGPVVQQAPQPEEPHIPVTTAIPTPGANGHVPSHRQPISTIRRVRRSIAKPVIRTKPDAPKPAIALAGPVSARIVVVSAEQLQREREQAARPQPRPQRPRASGLTGRLAFEALFKDETEPSKASGQ